MEWKQKRFNQEIIGVLLKIPRSWTKEIKQDLNVGCTPSSQRTWQISNESPSCFIFFILFILFTKWRFGNRNLIIYWNGVEMIFVCVLFVELELNFIYWHHFCCVLFTMCRIIFWNKSLALKYWNTNTNQMNISINNVSHCYIYA